MNVDCQWQEKMKFVASIKKPGTDELIKLNMDAKSPIGDSSAFTPKELLLAAICGCTSMDVASLMRKHKQNMIELVVSAQGNTSEPGIHPATFKNIQLTFKVKGDVDSSKLIEAVTLSQTKYCGVSAMVSKAVPIQFSVELNETKIYEGNAHFE